jgi:PAS domain S-box-containing protein
MNLYRKIIELKRICKEKCFNLNHGFRISDWFLFACIIFSAIIIIVILSFHELSKTLIAIELPHSKLLNNLYFVLDPLVLVFITGIIVFSKYFALLIPNSELKLTNLLKNWKRIILRLSLSVFFLITALYFLNTIENYVIKPIFSVSRPIFRLEHSIANSIYENGYQNYKLKKDFSENQINSTVLKALYRLQNDSSFSSLNRNAILSTILKDDIIYDIDEINKAIDIVIYNRGNYNHDISLQEKYNFLINVYYNKENIPVLWLTSKFEENKETDLNSTPSGFIIRIVFIWFLGAILITQKRKVRIAALLKNRICFILFLSIALLIIGWSRVYGFYHTFYDELISFTFVDIFVIAMILIYYVLVKNKFKKNTFLYNKYYNEVPENFYITDDNDKIISCNRVFEKTFGFNLGEAIGVDIKELYVDKDDRLKLKDTLRKSRSQEIIDYLVYVHQYKKPEMSFVISVNSRPYIEKKSKVSNGIEGTARNVSKIISNLVDGFYQVDNDERISYCNSKFCEIFGFSNSLMLKGQNIRILYCFANEREKFLEMLGREGSIANFIVTCKKFTDPLNISKFDKVFVEVNSQYINPENTNQGIQGTIRELPFGQAIITHSFHGIYVIQKTGDKFKFSFCNENLLRIFGYQNMNVNRFLDEVEVKDLIAPEYWDKIRKQLESKLKNENEYIKEHYVFKGVTKTGNKIPLEIISNHYPSFQNHPAVIGNLRDLTEELDEKARISANFTNKTTRAILHEIFNPLIGIRRDINILHDDLLKNTPDEKNELIRVYKSCVSNLNYCIKSATYLKDVDDKLKILSKKINLKEIIEGYTLTKKLPENIKVNINIDNNVNFNGDEIGCEIVLSNLIRNSSESTNEQCLIKLYTEDIDADRFILYFEDNGSGIEQNAINNLFELFTLARRKGHQGLGLITTKTIITNWGGDISLYKTSSEGTIFKINLKK